MPEVQDIIKEYGGDYLQKHRISYVQFKAFSAISKCRTAELGGHTNVCENCGTADISYNSCRNRHCPKCQTLNKELWIESRKNDLLNVGYFHVVFTLPHELNTTIYRNQKTCYNLMFKAVSETLKELCNDKKYLDAYIGFTSILHTWGQNLCFHPHIHCVIPSGGIDSSGKWKSSRKKFFLPVKVLSKVFRGKFLYYLKNEKLELLDETIDFHNLIDLSYRKEWVVYCKPPFKTAASVVEYLGRYTHRIAISNNRILSVKDGFITFKWRNYKDNSKWKVMTVSAVEFIRRFLMRVLPHGYTKIRHYGLFAGRNKFFKINLCKFLTHTPFKEQIKSTVQSIYEKLFGKRICKHCGSCKFARLPLPP